MSDVALNVLPVFALILLGWVLVRAGYLREELGEGLGEFVFRVAVPVLLFRTIAEADFAGGAPWRIWVAYFAGVAVTWAIAHLVATLGFRRDRRIGVLAGVSAAFANTVFIGLPLVSRVVGEDGLVAISVLLSVHLPTMMIAGTVLMERAERKEGVREPQSLSELLLGIVRNLVRNPLVIGLFAGALFHTGGVPLVGPVKVMVDQVAGMAAPAALMSIGMALVRYKVAGNARIALAMTALKLLLLPGCVYVACRLLGLTPEWTAAMVLTASVPTGVNAWLLANHFGVGHALASSTITMTTALGVFTVSFWAWLLA
ncbi:MULTISPECIES: AEC family transporter [Shinella]|uniref:AEC family transporter n=2 Tax=Shinella TaxID=323620 RepID=A0AA50H795_9HYPH|nr:MULTISPECIES: AEC family transporter [Shinella]MCD1266042.1 AEC family transporter [Shinella sumterensis]TFE97771.1 transporter [Shinella sumterensis]WLR96559.1 AEC family transporter [Shinella sumterensis]WLS04233.1 AEC family transporter [Shinella oryzae]